MEPDEGPAPSLDALIEAPLPPPVSATPATPAWTVLLVVVGLVLVAAALLLWRRWRQNRYRRQGLAVLDELASRGGLKQIPVLVKRVALEAWPRTEVADLTGDDWLAFLDASYGGRGFSQGPGRVLPSLAYAGSPLPEEADRAALVTLIRTWIRTHRGAHR